MAGYVPKRGDVIWIDFDPQAGHEQARHRPALVISPERYNRMTGFVLCCPMTTKAKGFVFEVDIEAPDGTRGAVLSDQLSSLDYKERGATYFFDADPSVVTDVRAKAITLIK
jgi:mRNA interferase MazF